MSLFIASLNSGSNGNCYYVGNNNEAVLIDAGISCRETEKRMNRLGLSMQKVKAVFISHEHDDHINGIESLAKKHALPVYITETTLRNCRFKLQPEQVHHFCSNERIRIGGLTIKAFAKLHDACDPHSFIIQNGEDVCIGVFTDIGKACEQVIYHFKQCNAVFLEANYDGAMLAAGGYPWFLKKRISGGNGHLSNAEALELFNMHRSDKLTHLILSHLSSNNNTPELVEQTFLQHAGETKIVVASRYHETEVYHIKNNAPAIKETFYFNQAAVQLTMFG
ncbi:MBL fold metallo-hydrolase [Parafilimonas terrae]|uniref:Phosphoribosyl 1,2-cyclic phosphodiesterase n=1 Tax=Parafilimonas terrae TaxID=1465490 RepID=A0A1I5YYU8_9BACT|nr:MBL fold metallo-hydrolase [Parafilimonas terrae]SFQ49443.1 Phosphoribosyl 1,2-cyclic phosphodiesterase [Parafilimonas terrae]